MDASGMPPRVVLWAYSQDTDTWKLWVVPPATLTDKHEFYRRIAALVTNNRDTLHGLEVSDVEMVSDKHPAIVAMQSMFGVKDGEVHVTGTRFDNYYLPDGIILRMTR